MEDDAEKRSDISAAARAELNIIQGRARSAANRYQAGIVRYHLQDIDALINDILKVK
jgi:hypothetical protein